MARILIVDDNEGVRVTLKFILESRGHAAVVAAGGMEALKIMEEKKPDIIITDMLMPEMDGAEFMMRVREKCSEIPIIAVSGGGNKINMEEALDIARMLADRVLRKPFTNEEVVEAIDGLLKKK